MNHLQDNPVGIDKKIRQTQERIYSHLGYSNFNGYPRLYEIEIDGQVVPTRFKGGEDYQPVMINDGSNGCFFFIEGGESVLPQSSQIENPIDIVFMVDLAKVKPSATHRADEDVRIEILDAIQKVPWFNLSKIIKGKDAVKDYGIGLIDMQPYHFLRFSGSIKFQHNI